MAATTEARRVLETATTIAVVGASPDPGRYGHEVQAALEAAGCAVRLVNPKYTVIGDRPCHPSLRDIRERIDLAVLVLSPANAVRALDDVVRSGVPTVWLPPGTATDELSAAARSRGLDVVEEVSPVALLRGSRHVSGTRAPAVPGSRHA